ncbi:aldose epimerase family protein [Mucilaginibacter sp. SG564]|uniref:aldose epimerase family protein n=1 Tax=Mucilaginibacter sp. SG564 TaxID=2587022 RepID=UPI001554BE48|nr:aldose epimerase family protein [Mucilaginibacter sp. SG564]NOW94221.1 aldose 1-epimerase [Mucilaginibacter sp. SG564]
MKYTISQKNWGEYNGHQIFLYELSNDNGIKASITNFGAAIQSLSVPDNQGNMADVVLGYDDLQGYIDDQFYIGTVVGRFANRIAGGKVEINGTSYQLTVKDGGFHHHGGKVGFNKKVWQSKSFTNEDGVGVILEYLSIDGEEGFPGNLTTLVTYTLNNQNQLIVDFAAKTDQSTLINLTQHAYFNLAGHDAGSILDHQLMLPLTDYLPVNAMQVPEGTLTPVSGTPFDFTEPTAIGKRINEDNAQLVLSRGYDHSWVVKKQDSDELKLAATVFESGSKRTLNVFTTEPAIHIYTGNFLDETIIGKQNSSYPFRSGLCLETQHYPDAPNKHHFPSTQLNPGEEFKSRTIFEFGINS